MKVEHRIVRDRVTWKSTTESTIQFDPLLLMFSTDNVNSLTIPSMSIVAESDRTMAEVGKHTVVCCSSPSAVVR